MLTFSPQLLQEQKLICLVTELVYPASSSPLCIYMVRSVNGELGLVSALQFATNILGRHRVHISPQLIYIILRIFRTGLSRALTSPATVEPFLPLRLFLDNRRSAVSSADDLGRLLVVDFLRVCVEEREGSYT